MGFQVAVESENVFAVRTVECQQVEFQVEQQQNKRDGPVRCVCEERPPVDHRKSVEPDMVHGLLQLAVCMALQRGLQLLI